MTDTEQRIAAKEFADEWKNKGYEKGESQSFWLSLLRDVLGVKHPEQYIKFEEQVHLDHTSFIDGYIQTTKVLIEQKGLGKDLNKPIKQSDGRLLTPFQQAKRYITELPLSQHPRWVVTCNFSEFYIYDMERPDGEPKKIKLANLEKDYYRLSFLVDVENVHLQHEEQVSKDAGKIVGLLYDALQKQYADPTSEYALKSLNVLCVRFVFCLYAEDAGIFGRREMFHDYLAEYSTNRLRKAVVELFKVLDQKPEERDPYLKSDSPRLAEFPYVNGGLFSDENIEVPPFTDEIRELLLVKASENFDWSDISPTIFGAVFESTLSAKIRRKGGMHYTSIENIHKVIDPLFLDNLKKELEDIERIEVVRTRKRRLQDFQDKIASLTFLDPACGSGNFLTETYLSLRRLENKIMADLMDGQMVIGEVVNPIKVSISQFYGIEINDFAVTVAKTALWIAESQTMKETENIVMMSLDFLPLKTNAHIHEGNALRMDWKQVVSPNNLSYIMGNPPFVGQQLKSDEQSEDMAFVFGKGSPETKLDYVLCWYMKAMEYISSTARQILVAFVSTNSVCQGESVPTFWKKMNDMGTTIIFAHHSFEWGNESTDNAAVICIIVGFCKGQYTGEKYLFDGKAKKKVSHINAYLHDGTDIWITSRKNIPPIGFPKMIKGSEPTDGGNLFFDEEEKIQLINKYPILEKYIRPFVGGDEYLNNPQGIYSRYCLWVDGGSPADLIDIKEVKQRLENITEKRRESRADRIRKRASVPYLFCQIRQPQTDYLLFPQHTSGDREYIPIGFMSYDVIVGNACYLIASADLYLFGILMSNAHMAWTNLVCGRLGTGYRYSPAIYNNFPFPQITSESKKIIEKTARGIIDARKLYPEKTLAEMYSNIFLFPELLYAHQRNDIAVLSAYGVTNKSIEYSTKSAFIENVLMKRYEEINANK